MNMTEVSPIILISRDVWLRGELVRRFRGVLWSSLCFAEWEEARQAILDARPPVIVADRDWEELQALAAQLDPSPLVVALCPTIESLSRALKCDVYDTVLQPFEAMEPMWTIACALHFATSRTAGRQEAPCGAA